MKNYLENDVKVTTRIEDAIQANNPFASPSQRCKGDDNSLSELGGIIYEQVITLRGLANIFHDKLLGGEQKCIPESMNEGLIDLIKSTVQ